MTIVDSVSTIIGATVVVVLALGVVAYLVIKVLPAREVSGEEPPPDGSWYFVRYDPDGGATDES